MFYLHREERFGWVFHYLCEGTFCCCYRSFFQYSQLQRLISLAAHLYFTNPHKIGNLGQPRLAQARQGQARQVTFLMSTVGQFCLYPNRSLKPLAYQTWPRLINNIDIVLAQARSSSRRQIGTNEPNQQYGRLVGFFLNGYPIRTGTIQEATSSTYRQVPRFGGRIPAERHGRWLDGHDVCSFQIKQARQEFFRGVVQILRPQR